MIAYKTSSLLPHEALKFVEWFQEAMNLKVRIISKGIDNTVLCFGLGMDEVAKCRQHEKYLKENAQQTASEYLESIDDFDSDTVMELLTIMRKQEELTKA